MQERPDDLQFAVLVSRPAAQQLKGGPGQLPGPVLPGYCSQHQSYAHAATAAATTALAHQPASVTYFGVTPEHLHNALAAARSAVKGIRLLDGTNQTPRPQIFVGAQKVVIYSCAAALRHNRWLLLVVLPAVLLPPAIFLLPVMSAVGCPAASAAACCLRCVTMLAFISSFE